MILGLRGNMNEKPGNFSDNEEQRRTSVSHKRYFNKGGGEVLIYSYNL